MTFAQRCPNDDLARKVTRDLGHLAVEKASHASATHLFHICIGNALGIQTGCSHPKPSDKQ